jgi:tRNA pseudouridine55 synthase
VSAETLAGVLVVDKPTGPSSHDVVQHVRRALQVRRAGHAGTLDPLATGVLVVMVGEATKLAPFLTAEDKSYAAVVRLGTATSTLDAEGEVTERGVLPDWLHVPEERAARLDRAVQLERGRTEQSPPLHSAIKVHGRSAYARARAGEQFALPPRAVEVRELRWGSVELRPSEPNAPPTDGDASEHADLELVLTVGKGYYVRSLARDIGQRLGVPAHLHALRRLRCGCFDLARAVPLGVDVGALRGALLDLAAAARLALPTATLHAQGVTRAVVGKPLSCEDFASPPATGAPAAWFDPDGRLVAVGELGAEGRGRVLRGFGATAQLAPPRHARYDEPTR